MKRILLLLCATLTLGCGAGDNDPSIKAERTVTGARGGGFVGPVGAAAQKSGTTDKYEGPASKAPNWAK